VSSRPLHAVLLPPQAAAGRLLDALGAALDGSGPAILPLDASLPRARLDELVSAFAPAVLETPQGSQKIAVPAAAGAARAGVPQTSVRDEVAVVLATSGSTGMPKAAELTADALLSSARASLARLGASPRAGGAGAGGAGTGGAGGRWLCCLPTHHISGLGVLVRSVISGSTPLITDRLDADSVARAAGGYVSLVPTQLNRLLDAGVPVGGLAAILLGGAAAPPDLLDRAARAGARVVTTYGMTETCGGCVYDGVPLDGVRIGQSADGRIRISGPVLFSGYRLAPDLTRAALDDGWFVTSDLGGLGPDGRLVVRGRADDVINTGGEKVVAGEVEHALRGCPQVRDVVVVGTPDPDWGERVTALVVAERADDPPTLAEVREQVRNLLPRYAAPQGLVIIDEIPMLASGKPDRQRLKRLAADG
jgi:o-succinylbenzoate---CoA ligase